MNQQTNSIRQLWSFITSSILLVFITSGTSQAIECQDGAAATKSVAASGLDVAEDEPLKVNETRRSKLSSKTADEYTVNAKEKSFVFGAVDQITVDVVVSIYDIDGKKLAEVDGPSRGPEYFHFETKKAGLYKIKVAPFEEETGDYGISLARIEPIATNSEDRVDQLMSQYDNKKTPGGVVAVVKGGKVTFARAYGVSNLTYGVPFEVDTRTNIGSTSKQFTAYAILLLAKQKKLSLDDDFRKHIPELPDLGEVVTLRHALTHTTGYREFLNTVGMTGRRLDRGDWIGREELVEIVQRQPELQNSPGSEFNYNNTGFGLLAEVVERVGEKPFPEWMKENVFEPLKMSDTFVRADPLTIVERASMGYAPDENGGFRNSPDLGGAVGAGGVYTTVGDLAKWVNNYRTGELGGKEIFKQMSTPFKLASGKSTGYGFGLFIDTFEGQPRIHHGGADSAHRSMVMYFPDLDAAVITQSNNAGFSPGIPGSVVRAFFADQFDKKKEQAKPEAAEIVDIDEKAFDKFAGRYELDEKAGFILTFSRDKDKFFTQATGQPKLEIIPTGPTSFKIQGVEAEVTFHPNDKGEVATLTLNQNGEHTAKKITTKPWSPDEKQLAAYVGTYLSGELETFYRIAIVDKKLVLKVKRLEESNLSPTSEHQFKAVKLGGTEFKFQADEEGKFMELVVGNGRTRGIIFKRFEIPKDTAKPNTALPK